MERIGRERPFRERDGDRAATRRDHLNGHAEEAHNRFRNRRGSGGEVDRTRFKSKQQRVDGDIEEELPTPRRTGFPEKLNKPWFRDANDQRSEKPFGDHDLQSPIRDSLGKENRHEQKPSWVEAPLPSATEPEPQTQQDFAAWKEAMKKGHCPKDSASKLPVNEGTGSNSLAPVGSQPTTPAADQPLFGLWGQQSQSEEKKVDEAKKTGKPQKVSRFFGAGAPKPSSEQVAPESPQAVASQTSPEEDENKRGFQNIMQMLRAGGSSSQSQDSPGFPPPPMQLPHHPKDPTPPANPRSHTPDQLHHSPHEAPNPHSPPAVAPANPQKYPNPSRDAEFLMNLMKQQQQRPPFQEGQIYGQNYNQRREHDDITSPINDIGPQQGKLPRPPPGFFDNQRAFATNSSIDISARGPPPEKLPEDQFSPQHMGPREQHQGPPLPDFRFPPPPPGDFGPSPPGPHQRPPSHEGIAPPPGFHPSRPNVPPGFPPFGPSQNGPPPPQMRGPPPPMHFNGPPPPGFGPQPPPGIGPQLQANGRRVPSHSIPPGFEMYGDLQRRHGAPPPLPQSSYAQYLKQGGGPAAYQGM